MLPHTPAHRTIWIVVVAGAIAVAGAALRIACVGASCEQAESTTADVPFCGLPSETRSLIARGYRDGRSPEILAVTGPVAVAGPGGTQWPSVDAPSAAVPVAFLGTDSTPEGGISLDEIAPTLAEAAGLDRDHPEVRSGRSLELFPGDEPARLLLVIAYKGAGPDEAAASEVFADAIATSGNQRAGAASLPADPAALLTTVGTGGVPSQHGITGSKLRNENGELVAAWGPRSPTAVIAALGDDLDQSSGLRARIGLVATDRTDRGLVGSDWYLRGDSDDIEIVTPKEVGRAASGLFDSGYGDDAVTDLLAVTIEGSPHRFDRIAGPLIEAAVDASGGRLAGAIVGTGPSGPGDVSYEAVSEHVATEVGAPIVEAAAPGGIYLDKQSSAGAGVAQDEIRRALASLRHNGSRVFEDVFGAIAVSLERYC